MNDRSGASSARASVPAMPSAGTEDGAYARRLERLQSVWWKRLLDVQRPYRNHLRRLRLGFVLDVGCGTGRNLANLSRLGGAVGVDHDPEAVAIAKGRGLEAYLPDEFRTSRRAEPGRFDSLLFAHVAEHLGSNGAADLLLQYLPYVRPGGRVVLITPQEAGYRSDPTHVEFMDTRTLERLSRDVGLEPLQAYSFPFPRFTGPVFKYNEFVAIARKP